ncbi:23S rRNA (guanosine(2251)-2'-O)-methyltransferase RlmB [Flavobacterium sp. CS20]|uniref:23S rRNA (guanosine(2251)-2'-O)-methyltransferase RlmB n=1 Tax=Flavobacterium sp. CS20 TaxID=2775246 RepID=UPI001B3A53AC|nr:23S rRNA (guanosine(2251)-2'-O)-methyltransferase RlmB [Flavobacterium sp. CS20]QTY26907.1 23S rRNA (guanosine(2251)-2'-O)-methyltransferase RlmB [Flavobacterium sp. CS20]
MQEQHTIFGIHPILEALKSNKPIDKIQILKGSENTQELLNLANQLHIKVSFVPHQKFRKYQSKNHQGVVAFIAPIDFVDFESTVEHALMKNSDAIFLLLDGVTDVRNFGSILRTAESSGVSAVIVPQQGTARINEDMVKTSAGAIFNIPICKVNHLKDAIYFLQAHEVKLIGASEKSNQSLFDANIIKPVALVMGSEGFGIHHSIIKMLDHTYYIPMKGKTQSLNVAVVAGLFLYELVR